MRSLYAEFEEWRRAHPTITGASGDPTFQEFERDITFAQGELQREREERQREREERQRERQHLERERERDRAHESRVLAQTGEISDAAAMTQMWHVWENSTAPMQALPSIDGLRDLLSRPLPFRMHLSDAMVPPDALFDVDAPFVAGNLLAATLQNFDRVILELKSDSSENDWQICYDVVLSLLIALCNNHGLELARARSKEDPTGATQRQMRPDYMLFASYLLPLLRGEEKAASARLSQPLDELTSKMCPWLPEVYGELPYTIGYATSGELITVVAIDQHHHKTELVPRLSVRQPHGKARLFKFAINFAFFVPAMMRFSRAAAVA